MAEKQMGRGNIMPGKRDYTNYQTLADLARIVGVDRTTILARVKSGKIKTTKRNLHTKKRHRLTEAIFWRCKPEYLQKKYGKPYPKYSTTWSETELYVMRNWTGTDEQLAKAIGRTVNAIRIKRTRLSPAYQRRKPQ